jgi:hypothetical protein
MFGFLSVQKNKHQPNTQLKKQKTKSKTTKDTLTMETPWYPKGEKLPIYVNNVRQILTNLSMIQYSSDDYFDILFNLDDKYKLRKETFHTFYESSDHLVLPIIVFKNQSLIPCLLDNQNKNKLKEYLLDNTPSNIPYVVNEYGECIYVVKEGLAKDIRENVKRIRISRKRKRCTDTDTNTVIDVEKLSEKPNALHIHIIQAGNMLVNYIQDTNYYCVCDLTKKSLHIRYIMRKTSMKPVEEIENLERVWNALNERLVKKKYMKYIMEHRLEDIIHAKDTGNPCDQFLKKICTKMNTRFKVGNIPIYCELPVKVGNKSGMQLSFENMGFTKQSQSPVAF